ADFLLICSNTIHKVAEAVSATVSVPLIHLADVTAEAVKKKGIGKVGLLGTIFTMEHDFYKGRLAQKHGLEVLIPEKEDRAFVNRVIDEELALGELKEASRARFLGIIDDLARRGVGGVILGCTEIPLLIKQPDTAVTLFDTTRLHSLAAVEEALKGDS
ncbi:MAG TPA: amino acid racemase, partial [Synergistales bacterium]|nr:amino acid racemase [Synergistales bacterium]